MQISVRDNLLIICHVKANDRIAEIDNISVWR